MEGTPCENLPYVNFFHEGTLPHKVVLVADPHDVAADSLMYANHRLHCSRRRSRHAELHSSTTEALILRGDADEL